MGKARTPGQRVDAAMGRRGPVGLGYMPKGGRAAAQAHNERVMPPVAAPVEPAVVEPAPGADRTDVRASARSAWWRSDRAAVVGTAAATAWVMSGLVEWLAR